MAFDLSQISVPFRMQPGLRRMDAGESHLTPLQEGSALYEEKLRVLERGESQQVISGFDTATAIAAIHAQASKEGHATRLDSGKALELAFEEDFAVLDAATGTVPWMCVCVPSHWAPEEKLGLSLAAIHSPVADNAALTAATEGLIRLVTQGQHWERHVWTLTPSPLYDQHPRRQTRLPWPQLNPMASQQDDADFASACYLRSERQTFFPAFTEEQNNPRQAVFTIKVTITPLVNAVRKLDAARQLHDSLASMSDAVLAYKNLAEARAPLLRWLARQA